jgi:ribA/ribD-fused uncharacterized protein
VEHYFQAQKFSDEKHIERIKRANSPREAKRLGGSRQFPIRADWDEVRDEVMFQACLKKFQANDDVKKLLLSTGEEELIENAPNDYYWGCGKNGTGQNQLGKTLMRVRKLLRSPGPN